MRRQKGETIFYELEQEYTGKAAEEERKLEKFYADKETSVRRIAVDNIREAKLKELEQDRQAGRRELAQRQKFVPSLELLQQELLYRPENLLIVFLPHQTIKYQLGIFLMGNCLL